MDPFRPCSYSKPVGPQDIAMNRGSNSKLKATSGLLKVDKNMHYAAGVYEIADGSGVAICRMVEQ